MPFRAFLDLQDHDTNVLKFLFSRTIKQVYSPHPNSLLHHQAFQAHSSRLLQFNSHSQTSLTKTTQLSKMKTTSIIAILGLSSLGFATPVEKRQAIKTVTIDIGPKQVFCKFFPVLSMLWNLFTNLYSDCNSPNYAAGEGCKLDTPTISKCREYRSLLL